MGYQDCLEAPANDDEWFTLYIKVDGNHVITKVNDKNRCRLDPACRLEKRANLKEFLVKVPSLFRDTIQEAQSYFVTFSSKDFPQKNSLQ